MVYDKHRYIAMEPVLHDINRSFVRFNREEEKRNNAILHEILSQIRYKMQQKNALFKELSTTVFYGGSYYDGLRVGNPDEFDLDLLLNFPKLTEITIMQCNKPGYINLKVNLTKLNSQPEMARRYKGLDKLINNKQFLDTGNVLRWMESVLTQALNEFERKNDKIVFKISHGEFLAKIHKGGPAFTLKVQEPIKMDVDLVPCFILGPEYWPKNGFKPNLDTRNPNFFIVPKPLKNLPHSSNYWRLSFQEQERLIIESKKFLKPTVKLVKKLRDTLDHKCIASYYLKTIALWMATEQKPQFWNNPLSFIFMMFLKEYHKCLLEGKLRYFWNKNNNLFGDIQPATCTNLANRIKAIISDVERHPEDGLVIAKYIVEKVTLPGLNSTDELSQKVDSNCIIL